MTRVSHKVAPVGFSSNTDEWLVAHLSEAPGLGMVVKVMLGTARYCPHTDGIKGSHYETVAWARWENDRLVGYCGDHAAAIKNPRPVGADECPF